MPSHRLKEIKTDYFTVCGYSVAGEETVIAVPELDVCFDIGKAPEQVISINNVLLTHGHIDHSSGLGYYLSHRLFCGQKYGTIYAPADIVEPIGKIVEAWGVLDGSKIEADIIPVRPGDEFWLRRDLILRVFKTSHNRSSVGYAVIETRKKLKPQYYGLSGRELIKLKENNVEIDSRIEVPLVAYTGDTSDADYSHLDYVRDSKVLIIECTFFEQEHIDRAKAGKHIHINSLASVLEKLNNEKVVLIHFSQRTHIKEAKELLKAKLPSDILDKVVILMDGRFG
jgi:ribonuclease Z